MSAHTDCLLAVYTLYMRSWFLRWDIQSECVSVVWMCFHILYGSERCVSWYLNIQKLIYKHISSHWACSKANTVSYQHANVLTPSQMSFSTANKLTKPKYAAVSMVQQTHPPHTSHLNASYYFRAQCSANRRTSRCAFSHFTSPAFWPSACWSPTEGNWCSFYSPSDSLPPPSRHDVMTPTLVGI